MTLLETLALLTLLATVGFGAFDIAYKIFHKKMTALSVSNLSGHFCYDFPERC